MRLQYLILAVPFLLTACATVDTYQEPRAGSQPLATITNSSARQGLFHWTNINLTSIDNKQVSSWKNTTNVTPGQHLFVVSYMFHRGGVFTGPPQEGIAELRTTVYANMNYTFAGNPDGIYMKIWLADRNGKRVSSIASSNYSAHAQPLIIPVIVPTH